MYIQGKSITHKQLKEEYKNDEIKIKPRGICKIFNRGYLL